MQSNQLAEFAKVCPEEWSINIETSLNIAAEQLEPLLKERFSFIIDVKAMQPEIYRKYTGLENGQVVHNLQILNKRIPQENYVVKVPLIPGYSAEADVEDSKRMLREMGITEENIVTFAYRAV